MRRKRKGLGWIPIALAIAVIAPACGSQDTAPVVTDSTIVDELAVSCDRAVAEDRRGLVTSQEMAFVGTVIRTSLEQNVSAGSQRGLVADGIMDDVESEERDERGENQAEAEIWPWTTFEVDAWYTGDAGERISIWTPGLELAVGERWLVAGAAFGTPEGLGDHMDQSGVAAVCASEGYGEAAAADWDEWFHGSVVPGANQPEGEPDPAAIHEIELAREKWKRLGPASYTARMRVSIEGGDVGSGAPCGSSGLLRIVVVDSTLEEALNVDRGCRIEDGSAVYLIDDLFDLAITASGAAESGYEIDPTYGFPRYLFGYDRGFQTDVYVESLVPGASRAVVGAEVGRDLEAMRVRWHESGINDYEFVVEWLCFCAFSGPTVVTVVDGVTESVVFEGESFLEDGTVDPQFLDSIPGTIDELFDLIEAETDDAYLVVAGFESRLGYPTDVYIDSIENAVDDELTIVISSFEAR